MWLPIEVREYTKNNKPIPFNLFLKYKGEYNSNKKVLIQCKECNNDMEMVWNRLKENNYTEEICWKCVAKKGRNLKVPIELQNKGTKENPLSYKVYLKYKDSYPKGCKKWIEIKCIECNEIKLVQWRKIANRTYSKDMAVCNDCIQKFKANLPEVKEINSKAQKIAQNRPEVKEKMRKSITNKIKADPIFRDKITRYSQKLCGYYKGIKFHSSWELSLIHYYNDKLKPCEIVIDYEYKGKKHLYLPDFELYEDEKKYLVEVKGEYRETDYIKIQTAKELISKGLLDYDDMKVIDRNSIKDLKNLILINNIELLNILDQNDLIIKNYPKSWKIKENKL